MLWGSWGATLGLAGLLAVAVALPPVVKIGAIFTEDQRDSATELAFKYAVYKINKDKTLLPYTSLVYDIQYVPRDDSFHASKKACNQVQHGVHAVFGPSDPLLGAHIHSICDALDIPHLEARLDLDTDIREFSINLHPAQHLLNTAFQDVMAFLNWTKVAIIYEEDYGLIKLRELVRSPHNGDLEIHLRQADPESYRAVLKEIKSKEIHNIVIDTKPSNMQHFLKGILQLQMNDYKYHYLFTTFDMETFDLEDFKYNFVNMTAFRVVDVTDLSVQEVLRDMARFQANINADSKLNSTYLQAEAALIYDSVFVFAIGLQTLEQSHTLKLSNVSCDKEQPWLEGLSLINYINAVEFKGLSGPIEFKEGRRIQFKLDLLKLKQHALVKVGEWRPGAGVNITDRAAFFDPGTMNVTLVVTTILKADLAVGSMTINYARESVIDFTKPFMNLGISILFKVPTDKESAFFSFFSPLGFDIWIFVGGAFFMSSFTLFTLARFTPYEWVYPQPWKRSKYLVNQLSMSNSFWFIAGTLLRQPSGVNPQVPTSQQARLFSFMNPLAMDIWMYVFSAYVLVSITMFVVARFSPYEWHNPHPCDMENELVENQFSLANSFWFTIGTLMQQGSDLNPKATSTRIVGGIWWFFTLIIISSYTANLAAFLTVERMITPIENAEDLAGQTEIPYGTLESGSTMTFFRDSMIETYKKMWRFMENRKPSVFVPTYEEGIQRVLEGNYAFLMESTMLDYTVQRDCNLTQIGGLLDSKGYGIATPMGSPWRDKISLAILELQEKGEIQMLYDKWWKNTGETCSRNEKGKESKANSLGVDNIGGVFVVLLCGLAFAVIIAICEFCYNSKKNALTEKRSASAPHQSLCSEMGGELCFALRCRGSRQRPALRRQCSKCLPGATYVPAMLDIPPHPPQPPSRPPPTNGLSAHVCPEDTSLRDRMMIPLELQHHMQPQHPLHQQLDN
nr:PREDICTED: glutamate receptor ionotropic, kainate 2 isoform X7 [Tribolium castaneum]|eukprot:XP_015833587.1 PREDICTED: glutamate receptor ionotropic, kainate 2 isoform X7 [Tribolium castaneum]